MENNSTDVFLSTPSARRATRWFFFCERFRNISIHALREEGDGAVSDLCTGRSISIHALREEGDHGLLLFLPDISISIHALREEGDEDVIGVDGGRRISIHALREEGDHKLTQLPKIRRNFYPRPPRGGRQRKQRSN